MSVNITSAQKTPGKPIAGIFQRGRAVLLNSDCRTFTAAYELHAKSGKVALIVADKFDEFVSAGLVREFDAPNVPFELAGPKDLQIIFRRIIDKAGGQPFRIAEAPWLIHAIEPLRAQPGAKSGSIGQAGKVLISPVGGDGL